MADVNARGFVVITDNFGCVIGRLAVGLLRAFVPIWDEKAEEEVSFSLNIYRNI